MLNRKVTNFIVCKLIAILLLGWVVFSMMPPTSSCECAHGTSSTEPENTISTGTRSRAIILSESFPGSGVWPSGWSVLDYGTGHEWIHAADTTGFFGAAAKSGVAGVEYSSTAQTEDTYLVTPTLDLSDYTDIQLQFYEQFRGGYSSYWSYGYVYGSTNGGASWTAYQNLLHSYPPSAPDTTEPPQTVTLNLAWADGQSNVKLAWRYYGNYDWWWVVDDVLITGTPVVTNNPPSTPSFPSGPDAGYTGDTLVYSSSSSDPDGDNLRFGWDWGDGSAIEWSGWYTSPATDTRSHIWSTAGTYAIKVIAEDINGAQSGWSPAKTVVISTAPSPNNEPSLSSPSLTPTEGDTSTTFTYMVTYTDADNDAPSYINVYIDGTLYPMNPEDPLDVTYTDGKIYYYSTTLPVGDHNYYFKCSDGIAETRLPSTSTYSGPTVSIANSPPILSWVGTTGYVDDGVEPDYGTLDTNFVFKISYTDSEDPSAAPPPPTVKVVIDGSEYVMSTMDYVYSDGSIFSYEKTFTIEGEHTYYFIAVDANGATTAMPSNAPLETMTLTVNHVPVLSVNPPVPVEPDLAIVGDEITYSVVYSDADNQPPEIKSVYIDGIEHTMSIDTTAPEHEPVPDYTNGERYVYKTTLSPSETPYTYEYRFVFSDGYETVEYFGTGPQILAGWPDLELLTSGIAIEFVPEASLPTDAYIYATVKNIGLSDILDPFVIEFWYDYDPALQPPYPALSNAIGTATVDALAAQASVTVQVVWEDLATPGTNVIYVAVDRADNIHEVIEYETSDTNNLASKTLQVGSDLWIDRITPHGAIHGKEINIVAKVRNLGKTDAGPFTVKFEHEGIDIGTSPVIVSGVPGNGWVDVICTWTVPPDVGEYEITVTVDIGDAVQEFDEENNYRDAIITVIAPIHISTSFNPTIDLILIVLLFVIGLVAVHHISGKHNK